MTTTNTSVTPAHPLRHFYLHNSLKTLAEVCAGSFFLAYFYKQGFTFTQLALVMAGIYALRFVVRRVMLPLMERTDLKYGLIAGVMLFPLHYLAALPVHGVGPWLFVFMFLFALSDAIYCTYYHAYWTSIMDTTRRAAAFGTREALAQVTQVLGSVASGYLLVARGPIISFGMSAVVMLLSCIPLLRLPNRPAFDITQRPKLNPRSIAHIHRILVTEGFFAVGMGAMWSITLFTVAGDSFIGYGILLAIASLLLGLGDYILGRHFDAVPRHWLAALGACLMFADLFGRALFAVSVPVIIGFNILAAIASVAYYMAHSQMSYGCIQESGYPLKAAWHHESSWDAGAVAGLLLAAAVTAAGASPRLALMLNAFGALGAGWFMFQYYRADGAASQGRRCNP